MVKTNSLSDVFGAAFGIALLTLFSVGIYSKNFPNTASSPSIELSGMVEELSRADNTERLGELIENADWSSAKGITSISDTISEIYSN